MKKISKGEKQFVRTFFKLKDLKRAFRAIYTYKFRVDVLRRLDDHENRLNKLETLHGIEKIIIKKKEPK